MRERESVEGSRLLLTWSFTVVRLRRSAIVTFMAGARICLEKVVVFGYPISVR